MDVRQLINEMAHELEMVNKSFTAGDMEINREHYQFLREAINTLNCIGVTVKVAETWERGLVCVEVTLDKVRF